MDEDVDVNEDPVLMVSIEDGEMMGIVSSFFGSDSKSHPPSMSGKLDRFIFGFLSILGFDLCRILFFRTVLSGKENSSSRRHFCWFLKIKKENRNNRNV